MRRGAKPKKASSPGNAGLTVRDLEQRLAEAWDHHEATAEILRLISSSPTDVQPVFAAVAASAARLCDAFDAAIFRVDGNALRLVAHHGPIPAHALGQGPPLVRGTPPGRAVLERRTIHVADMQAEVNDYPEGSTIARRLGHRTALIVPMLRAGEALGAISVRRTEVRPFTDRQVELLKLFADQAVLAIENVQRFNETKEALEQQTAMAEILRVISSSPTDLQPTLDAIATRAALVCGAYDATVVLLEGGLLRRVTHHGPIAHALQETRPLDRGSLTGVAILDRRPAHVHDILATESTDFLHTRASAREAGFRTGLAVPLLREQEAIGAIGIRRQEVQPFTDKQIALLQTFADQAVIAIENVRLFNETKEALEQQTATSEILRVISSSPTDVRPVFDVIVQNAARLCDARDASLYRREDDVVRCVANYGRVTSAAVGETRPITRGTGSGRAILDGQTIHLTDVLAEVSEFPDVAAAIRREGIRAVLSVPLLRDGRPFGAITIRRTEARPFSEKQIKLLETFADQAVIAIENVRLFTELQRRIRR